MRPDDPAKRMIATSVTRSGKADPALMKLCDLLGETAMAFARDNETVAGRYIVEIKHDGSLMSLRSVVEPFDREEATAAPLPYAGLAAMYEQIVPSAEAYFAECGEKPPLMADMYDRFVEAGFDVSMCERVTEERSVQ